MQDQQSDWRKIAQRIQKQDMKTTREREEILTTDQRGMSTVLSEEEVANITKHNVKENEDL